MANESHVIDLLPAFALGCLDEEESAQVSEHLAKCAGCRAEGQPYLTVAEQLALASPDALPPARVKKQLMQRIARAQGAPTARPGPSWWQQVAGLFRRPAVAWTAASLTAIVALAMLWFQPRIPSRHTMPAGTQVIALAGTEAAPDAHGTLIISADGEYGTLVVEGLPGLDPARQYQVWLIRGGQSTSGGVFSVNDHGYGAIELMAPEPLGGYPSFGVTIEPSGGSSGPTGDRVLAGSL